MVKKEVEVQKSKVKQIKTEEPSLKIKSILVTQPKPDSDKSPYNHIIKKYNLKVDFRPFIFVEGIPAKDFRASRININDYTSVVLTSKHAADNFVRMCQEMRIDDVEKFKYFCISESTAYYLQKFVQFRKRRIFFGKQTIYDLMDVLKKHKKEKFLVPCSDVAKQEIFDALTANDIAYQQMTIYRTVCSDLSDLANVNYDLLVFFSPSGITSLFKNFPKFKQNNTRIAAFGNTTSQAVLDAGLRLDIKAPVPESPSMTMAIENFLKKSNK